MFGFDAGAVVHSVAINRGIMKITIHITVYMYYVCFLSYVAATTIEIFCHVPDKRCCVTNKTC